MPQVKEILAKKQSHVVTAHPHQSVMEAVKLMNEHRIGAIVILENDEVVGIFFRTGLFKPGRRQGTSFSKNQNCPGHEQSRGLLHSRN